MSPALTTDQILARVQNRGGEGCWPWIGQINNKGYGLVSHRARKRVAHGVVYELLVGPIPPGLELDHTCVNPICCNPEHLDPVTHRENQRRAAARMTGCRRAGHDWSIPRNVYVHPNGKRRCRECARILDRTRIPRRKVAA